MFGIFVICCFIFHGVWIKLCAFLNTTARSILNQTSGSNQWYVTRCLWQWDRSTDRRSGQPSRTSGQIKDLHDLWADIAWELGVTSRVSGRQALSIGGKPEDGLTKYWHKAAIDSHTPYTFSFFANLSTIDKPIGQIQRSSGVTLPTSQDSNCRRLVDADEDLAICLHMLDCQQHLAPPLCKPWELRSRHQILWYRKPWKKNKITTKTMENHNKTIENLQSVHFVLALSFPWVFDAHRSVSSVHRLACSAAVPLGAGLNNPQRSFCGRNPKRIAWERERIKNALLQVSNEYIYIYMHQFSQPLPPPSHMAPVVAPSPLWCGVVWV